MESIKLKEVTYNNKLIKLNKEITIYSDGSYARADGVRRYGNSNGNYLKMSLYDENGKEHKVFMHTLILCVFGSDRPSEDYEVDHIDRNKHNNDISNLRWVIRKLNIVNKADRKQYGDKSFVEIFYQSKNPYNLSYDVVHHRLFNLKWDLTKALNTPLIERNAVTERRKQGHEKRKSELRKWYDEQEVEEKVPYKKFYHRVKVYGMDKEKAIK